MKYLQKIAAVFILSCTTIFSYGQNTGIGTTTPTGKLHVAATTDTVPFKVSVNNNTKLKVTSNGGVAIGTNANPPANGLYVQGKFEPGDSIKSTTNPIYITSTSDSVVLQAGNTTIILSSSGAVRIKASGSAGISLDAGSGNVNISGANVNIKALASATLSGSNVAVEGASVSRIIGPLVTIGGATGPFLPAARQTDTIYGTSFPGGGPVYGNVTSGSSVVLIQ